MAQKLNQVPPDMDVWEVQGSHFLVRLIPDTTPPIPLVWFVQSSDDRKALGIKKADRVFDSWGEFYSTGALRHGNTTELLNTTEDPWDQIQSNYESEVKVKPWLNDPEILGLWFAAALEGRSITTAELQGSEWWRTHTEAERQWITINAEDPASAESMIADNRLRVADLLRSAGVSNASSDLVNTIADQWTTGAWSEIYATNQIRLLADPTLAAGGQHGTIDNLIKSFRDGLDSTRAGEDTVRDLVATWVGPAGAQGWTENWIKEWGSRLREDPDSKTELVELLRGQRMALFPTYENPNLTYEDIAAPWRGVWEQQWGQVADETNPLFTQILNLNDRGAAEKLLRTEGLKVGNQTVSQRFLADINQAFGGQVRRADPAIQ